MPSIYYINSCVLLQYERPAYITQDLKCIYIHHQNPYLKLGPFKFEILNNGPQIGYVHDFSSDSEIQQLIADAIPRTKTTSYDFDHDYDVNSRWHTSKVMYINERLNDNAMKISRKIELMTRTQLTKDMYDSENYQVIQGFVTKFRKFPPLTYLFCTDCELWNGWSNISSQRFIE